jgi:hypothetical protein
MEPQAKPEPQKNQPDLSEPAEHIAGAHKLLTALNEKFGHLERHPELQEAIQKLELALNALNVSTAGLL